MKAVAPGVPVDVFLARGTSSSVPADDDWLTPAERRVCAGLTVPKRVADWRLGRWVAKEAVRRALEMPDLRGRDIEILASPTGGPVVALTRGGTWPDLRLSLSHAGGMGLAAVILGEMRIGCDVEEIRPRSEAFVSDYFTAPEVARVRHAPAAEQATLANLLWSAKESALKLLGEGLRMDTRAVEVVVSPKPVGESWKQLTVATGGGHVLEGRWRVTGGFVWTVVTEAPMGQLLGMPLE